MGTWGFGSFDNSTAAEFINEIDELIVTKITKAIKTAESEYFAGYTNKQQTSMDREAEAAVALLVRLSSRSTHPFTIRREADMADIYVAAEFVMDHIYRRAKDVLGASPDRLRVITSLKRRLHAVK